MTSTPAVPDNLEPTVINAKEIEDTFREDVLTGLRRPAKAVPAKHLYDERGSEIFDEITEVPEYYPTRVERSIFESHHDDIAATLGPRATLIEPGAGSCEKADMLLGWLDEPEAFVPIEISQTAVEPGARMVAQNHRHVRVHPVCADFTAEPTALPFAHRRVVFFPGSTIGNLEMPQRLELLKQFGRYARPGGRVLIGYDLVKDPPPMLAAYNDSSGVTASFNLNLLQRINDQLGGTFDIDGFAHDAPWVEDRSRIEMHLVSQRAQTVTIEDEVFEFAEGERMHTENSHKFTTDQFDSEASETGLRPIKHWTDDDQWFALGLYEAM